MRQHTPNQRELIQSIRRHGWTVMKHRKHFRCYSPDGSVMVSFGHTISDQRAIHNIRARFRNYGGIEV